MDSEAVERVLLAFFADVRRIFTTELAQVRGATGSKSAHEANSKFEGFEGSFATLEEFHAGAEATLQLGYPNPDIEKGIRLEHTQHPASMRRLFVTPNYRLATCLLVEYWWAMDPSSPPKEVLDLVAQLGAARGAEEEGDGRGAREEEGGYARRLDGAAGLISLVRGGSEDVDVDPADGTVTFRCLCSTTLLIFYISAVV